MCFLRESYSCALSCFRRIAFYYRVTPRSDEKKGGRSLHLPLSPLPAHFLGRFRPERLWVHPWVDPPRTTNPEALASLGGASAHAIILGKLNRHPAYRQPCTSNIPLPFHPRPPCTSADISPLPSPILVPLYFLVTYAF